MTELKTPKNSALYQYLVTICGNLLIISFGTSVGWPSTSSSILQSDLTPLSSGPLTTNEASWIVSLYCFTGFASTLAFGYIADKYGRKTTLLLLAIPQIASWILTIYATNVTYLYAARLLVGVTGGGAYVVLPTLVAEVSEDRVRGALGTIITVSLNFGVLLMFIAGNYLSYDIIPKVSVILPIMFLFFFIGFPESPIYLMSINQPKKAERSLQIYRNSKNEAQQNSAYFQGELAKMSNVLKEKQQKSVDTIKLTYDDFFSKVPRKAFLIVLFVFTLSEFNGCAILINYTTTIFSESGSTLSEESSAIIVAIIQLVGTYVSTILVDRSGRKILLILSSFGSGLSLTSLGTYTYLNGLGYDLENWDWIPIASFSALVFLAACGVIPLSYVLMTEIMPTKIRGIGSSVCLCYSWLVSFGLLKIFPIAIEVVGMHTCIGFFALCSFTGPLFVIFVMPETKGKSFEEINKILEL